MECRSIYWVAALALWMAAGSSSETRNGGAWVRLAHAADVKGRGGKEDLEARRRQQEELARKREKEQRLKKEFSHVFRTVAGRLVIVTHEWGAGSGFIAEMDGKDYIVTNQHVLLGAEQVRFSTLDGEQLRPRMVEVSDSRDIVRLLLDGHPGLELGHEVEMGAPVAVFGNSQGADVATEIYGEVTGIGAEALEISAEFVGGNSGSPVFNLEGKVIGVASYLRMPRKSSDTEGTRFEDQARRFCLRLAGTTWVPVDWRKYNSTCGEEYRENSEFISDVFGLLSGVTLPPRTLACRKGADQSLDDWVGGYNRAIKEFSFSLFGESDNRRFWFKVGKSMEDLSAICGRRAKRLRLFIKQQNLRGFLLREFEQHADVLESMEEYLKKAGR